MKLYGYWRSSCSWRVRIALALKGADFEAVPVHLVKDGGQHKQVSYREKNPMQQVPFLEFDSPQRLASGLELHGLAQSVAIIEYLDELLPQPPLVGTSAVERARVRWLTEMINSGIQPLQNLFVMQELSRVAPAVDSKAWSASFIERGLAALETTAGGADSRFLVGNMPSMADICLVPQLYNARRFSLDLSAYPRLCAIEAACFELEAFKLSHPDQQPDAET
ncbi:MAG: maleylacetoacetate isomerase [Polyangiaceae bacterium]|nr:maleylacetoacetate isomerase [Myxococcales bacterium]MCB9585847.1 maleylacetoacetate isomerase [Polyangiaceae bacterium]MCB9607224.1 maleylacetoacetate isomerase [Polyangiaceae bacterium]